jgi:MFS family permease
MLAFLDRHLSVAPPGFNRWRVPPAALAIHLSVGQAYAFSVFNIPLTRQLGIARPIPADWASTTVVWVFSIAIIFLGLSAAIFGKWLEAAGPRKAMFASAVCFGCGFQIGAAGVALHQFWLLALGYGVLGGIGLGLGYISPVSTLIKWFPDRPGMATGMAIMGFGGGAMIGSPLAVELMKQFASPSSTGVVPTLSVMGLIYFCFMMFGVFTVRLPAPGWKPAGYEPSSQPKALVTTANVTADNAIRTPQFWLLWVVLFVNVSAGIAILSQASPMIQEMFPGKVNAAAAAGFVGLLSLFNLAGRFAWSSLSDIIGRKRTYLAFFVLGVLLYAAVPSIGRSGNVVLFVGCFAVIMSMYGGGFATIPAYLRDLFGTIQVGAIHGRLLTAWSVAGIAGPLLISGLHDSQMAQGVSGTNAYSTAIYILAGFLGMGLVSNLLIRQVNARFAEPASPDASSIPLPSQSEEAAIAEVTHARHLLTLAWLVVGIPLAWGIWETVKKSLALF